MLWACLNRGGLCGGVSWRRPVTTVTVTDLRNEDLRHDFSLHERASGSGSASSSAPLQPLLQSAQSANQREPTKYYHVSSKQREFHELVRRLGCLRGLPLAEYCTGDCAFWHPLPRLPSGLEMLVVAHLLSTDQGIAKALRPRPRFPAKQYRARWGHW